MSQPVSWTSLATSTLLRTSLSWKAVDHAVKSHVAAHDVIIWHTTHIKDYDNQYAYFKDHKIALLKYVYYNTRLRCQCLRIQHQSSDYQITNRHTVSPILPEKGLLHWASCLVSFATHAHWSCGVHSDRMWHSAQWTGAYTVVLYWWQCFAYRLHACLQLVFHCSTLSTAASLSLVVEVMSYVQTRSAAAAVELTHCMQQ